MENRNKLIWQEFCKIFWLFMIGSFIGFIYETIVVFFQTGGFELRQGIIYGPLIPVYGIGAVVYYLFFLFGKPKDKWEVFFFSMILRRYYRIYLFFSTRSCFWYNFMGLFLFKI